MRKRILIITSILLVLTVLVTLVYAGLDAAGGSLINCRTITSDTATIAISDNLRLDGNLYFDTLQRTVAGIQNQNLLDKSTSETISGDWLFYSDPLTVSGAVSIDGTLQVSGAITGASPVTFGDSINPENDNNYDIGSSSYHWRDLYISGDISSAPSTVDAWEVDGNDDLQPVSGSFNDLNFDLDSNGDIMPTLVVHFVVDTSGDLMPLP